MNDNTMHDMHSQANESLARRLSEQLLGLCSSAGDISKATQELTGGPLAGTDTPGLAGQGGHSGDSQGTGVKA